MFDIGWPEMAVIAVIALVIIGPKDLPRIMRYAGKWAGKAQKVAREFRRNFDDMVRESELDEVKKSIDQAGSFNPVKDIGNSIDPTGEIKQEIESLAKDPSEAPKPDDSPEAEATEAEATEAGDTPDADDPPKSQASA